MEYRNPHPWTPIKLIEKRYFPKDASNFPALNMCIIKIQLSNKLKSQSIKARINAALDI
jgi:hypothetical protein